MEQQMEKFKATVQYGDLKGSSAADRADMSDATSFLKENGYMKDGEFLVGIKMFVGENHGEHRNPVSVSFFITSEAGFKAVNQNTIVDDIRRIYIDMNVSEFFALFKRFEVSLSPNGVLENKDFTCE
jgi:hypothetical protein